MTEFSSNLTFDKQETVVLASRVPGGSASASGELEHALRATSIEIVVDARSSAGGSLVLTAEESDDGESWSELEAVGTLARTGSASLTVTPTKEWLRVAWDGGAGWTIDITATGHATIEAGNGGSQPVFTTRLDLTSAEILALGTHAITGAPGVGKLFLPLAASLYVRFGGVAYATNTSPRVDYSDGAGGHQGDYTMTFAAALAVTQDTILTAGNDGAANNDAPGAFLNQPLVVWVSGGSPTAGNGTLSLAVTYTVIDFS